MAANVQQTEKPRLIDSAWWNHFIRSNYVTWFTEWLLGFGGKSAHVVLIITTLYMSAQLYPGIHLPDGLSVAVFLIQMFALDMGGMGLASLARQAHADGNEEGARVAKRLSNWLIAIMIAGLVTVCLEQALSHIPGLAAVQPYIDAIKIFIEVVLVVARAVCAVLYGKTIHALRHVETVDAPAPAQVEPVDLQPLHDKITALEEQLATLVAAKSAQIVDTQPTPQLTAEQHANGGQDDGNNDGSTVTFVDNKPTKTQARGEGVKRARAILKRHPTITATDLAKRANISRSYASQLIQTQHRPGLRLVNE